MDAASLKTRVSLPELARHLGVDVRNDKLARCFQPDSHNNADRNPSMRLTSTHFECYGCGIKGDVFNLVQLLQGVDFKASLEYVASYAGETLDNANMRPARVAPTTRRRKPVSRPTTKQKHTSAPSDLHRRLWDIVRPLELTPEAVAWVAGKRWIRPETAHRLHCRDWWPVLADIATLLQSYDSEAKQAAGFYNAEGKPWWVLRAACDGKRQFQGLCVPQWLPGHDAPIGWRWRLYVPLKRTGKKPLKSVAQPGRGRRCPLGLVDVRGAETVVITEGEPDWLVVSDLGFTSIGICEVAKGWPDEFTAELDNAKRIVVLLHDSKAAHKCAADVLKSLIRRHGLTVAAQRFNRRLVGEDDDANILHKRGELLTLLEAATTENS